VDELLSFMRQYGVAIWNELKSRHSDVGDKYGLAVVLGVFMSIMHPKYKDTKETKLELIDVRKKGDTSVRPLEVTIEETDRNLLRRVM